MLMAPGASPAGGQCPPDFRFCPPDFFLAPLTEFFWEEEVDVFRRKKTLKFVILARKNLRISAKTFLFIFYFWRSPVFGRKICDFGQKKPSDFGENLFPRNLNFAPRSREAGDAPGWHITVFQAWLKNDMIISFQLIPTFL